MEIPYELFLNNPGNSTSFLIDPRISTWSFFSTSGNSMSSHPPAPTLPVWIFSGIAQCWSKYNFFDSAEIEIRLPFYRSFSTFWNRLFFLNILKYIFLSQHFEIDLVGYICTRNLYSWAWCKTWHKVISVIKLKVTQSQLKCKTRNLHNLLSWGNFFWNLCGKGRHRSFFEK